MSRYYEDDTEETFTENRDNSYDDERRYNDDRYSSNDYSDRYDDERITATTTATYDRYDSRPDPPDVPWPWRPRWSDRERTYIFEHQETGEEVWDYDEVIRRTRGGGGGYDEERTETVYKERDDRWGGGRRDDHVSEEMVETEDRRYDGGGYRGGYGREGYAEEAARWAGRKVGEVEDIPNDVRYGFDRVENGAHLVRVRSRAGR